MSSIKRVDVENQIEKKIVTGMIMNEEYLNVTMRMMRKDYFKNEYLRTISKWITQYHKKYRTCPGKQIEDIFLAERDRIKEAQAELIELLLTSLSKEYSEADADVRNYRYLEDETRDYFRKRAIEIITEGLQVTLDRGNVDKAEELISAFNQVSKELSSWFNPFDQANIRDVFSDSNDVLFRLPGELGDMVGDLERGWLLALMGPMKRGKSWYLQLFAVMALTCGLKVAYFSLEMNKKNVSKRIYKQLTAMADKMGTVSYPVFDCEKNQDGTCRKPERICVTKIKNPGEPTIYRPVKGYRPCTACRDENGWHDCVQAVWRQEYEQKKELNAKSVAKKVKDFVRLYGQKLRVMSYPAFSATFTNIISDMESLEYNEDFVPDVICVDYFDIMAQESTDLSERGNIDRAWKRGKGLAELKHSLMVTVLQSNRDSISKKSIEQENTGEDIRKLAHPDIVLGLNQTPAEKEEGKMRISTVVSRHSEFSFFKEVLVLQSLSTGQPLLDQCTVNNNQR